MISLHNLTIIEKILCIQPEYFTSAYIKTLLRLPGLGASQSKPMLKKFIRANKSYNVIFFLYLKDIAALICTYIILYTEMLSCCGVIQISIIHAWSCDT